MSTNDHTTPRAPSHVSLRRLTIPLVSLGIGIAYFIAGWVGGNRAFGIFGLVLMAVTGAALLVLTRYSETVAGLVDRRDERINAIDRDATTVAGTVTLLAVIIGFVVQIARGHDGSPFAMLGAIGGVSYVVALVVLRFRR